MEDKHLLQLVTDIGYEMLSCGSEIYRVEETVKRICAAYGCEQAEVFAIPSTIIVSITRQEETITKTRRLSSKSTDLEKLAQLNQLSRRLCNSTPDDQQAKVLLENILRQKSYSFWLVAVGQGMAALAFALFFGGHWKDAVWAFPIGVMIKVTEYLLGKVKANGFVITVVSGGVSALMAVLGVQIGFIQHIGHVLMGAIMNLVPGLMLTNAMRDIMASDFIAGLMRIAEAVLVGAGIAVGVMIPMSVFDGLLGESFVPSTLWTWLYAAAGVVAFGLIFNVKGKALVYAAAGGAISWFCYLLTADLLTTDILGYFCATVAMSVYSEVFARVKKCPVTVYLVPGLIPLVPGSGIYRTMQYFVSGQNDLFWQTGLYTLEIAAVIGFAMICVSSIVRMIFTGLSIRQRRKTA